MTSSADNSVVPAVIAEDAAMDFDSVQARTLDFEQSQAVCVNLSTMPNSQAPPMWNVFDVDVQPSGSLEYTTRSLKTRTKVFQLSAGITQRIRKQFVLLKEYNKLYGLEERFRWSSRQWFDLTSYCSESEESLEVLWDACYENQRTGEGHAFAAVDSQNARWHLLCNF